MDHDLSERQQAVLATIVHEYVEHKTPVGSDAIVRKYVTGVSPATVRNDMGLLAAAGFVCSPHTSSGRIPTDKGYRYYVRHLMRPIELSADERRMIDHQFHQIERDLDQWMQLAVTVVSKITESAAFVTRPLVRRSRLRHLDLIATQNRATLMVAVLQEGMLYQKLLPRADGIEQENLDQTARRITRELRGQPAGEISSWPGAQSALDRAVRDSLVELMRRIDQKEVGDIRYDGISYLLAAPEFSNPRGAQEILRSFEQQRVLLDLAQHVQEQPGVQVLIGDENPAPSLRHCGVVTTRYGSGALGALGVVGPTRLRYDRVIATIQYVGFLLTELWAELCGYGDGTIVTVPVRTAHLPPTNVSSPDERREAPTTRSISIPQFATQMSLTRTRQRRIT
jgi:heat-inducible transcriptional repressor